MIQRTRGPEDYNSTAHGRSHPFSREKEKQKEEKENKTFVPTEQDQKRTSVRPDGAQSLRSMTYDAYALYSMLPFPRRLLASGSFLLP